MDSEAVPDNCRDQGTRTRQATFGQLVQEPPELEVVLLLPEVGGAVEQYTRVDQEE